MTDFEIILRGLVKEPLIVESTSLLYGGATLGWNIWSGARNLFGVDLIPSTHEIRILPFKGIHPSEEFAIDDDRWIERIIELVNEHD